MESVWIFHGAGGQFTSGVFSSKERAIEWIEKYGLEGLLTKYPLDQGVFDWAVENGFTDANQRSSSAATIQKFSSAAMEHYHFEND